MPRKTLSMAENHALMKFIEAEYAMRNLTDGAFAALANETLKLNITEQHIETRRVALGIPATKNLNKETQGELRERVQNLEQQIGFLRIALDTLTRRFDVYTSKLV